MKKEVECELIEDLLLGYIDGTLNEKTREIVEKHLEECSECKNKLEDFKLDIVESENNEKKRIDYLKKIKKKARLKSIKIVIGIIFTIVCFIYLCDFIKFNHTLNKASKNLQSNNMYIQSIENSLNKEVYVTKKYYKEGKYKEINQTYSEEGIEINYIKYATVGTDENIFVNEKDKKITITKGENAKMENFEMNLKNVPFVDDNRLVFRAVCPAFLSINIQKFRGGSFYNEGKKCYVLEYKFDRTKDWEIWLDKETGLPLKEINRGGITSYYGDNLPEDVEITQENIKDILKQTNDIVKEVGDGIVEYRYDFNTVTNEDVEIQDFVGYDVEYVND